MCRKKSPKGGENWSTTTPPVTTWRRWRPPRRGTTSRLERWELRWWKSVLSAAGLIHLLLKQLVCAGRRRDESCPNCLWKHQQWIKGGAAYSLWQVMSCPDIHTSSITSESFHLFTVFFFFLFQPGWMLRFRILIHVQLAEHLLQRNAHGAILQRLHLKSVVTGSSSCWSWFIYL